MKNYLKIKIKKAILSDIDAFWNFYKWSVRNQFPEYSKKAKNEFLRKEYSKRNFKCWLRKRQRVLLLAFYKNEVVGYLLATTIPHGGITFIHWLGVKDSFQGGGIGSSLLKKYEKIVAKQEIHKIHVWTDKRTHKFYKKNGYKLVGHIPDNFYGADDWLFYKEIQSPKY